jgi:hypothetical protein
VVDERLPCGAHRLGEVELGPQVDQERLHTGVSDLGEVDGDVEPERVAGLTDEALGHRQ